MSDNATAQALADEVVPESTGTVETAEAEMNAAYDAILARDAEPEATEDATEEAPEPSEASVDEPPEEAVEEEANAPETLDAPSDLPFEVKQYWSEIPEKARNGILTAQRDMAQKLSDQGRLVSGLKPLQGTLTDMVQEFPSLSNMTPDQVAGEMRQLARINQAFNDNPVEAIMGLVQQHGLQEQFSAALQGQNTDAGAHVAQLQGEIAELKKALDPSVQRQNYDAWRNETTVQDQVTAFSGEQANWSQVEPHLPAAIPAVRSFLGEDASPADVLSKAYEMVESQLGIAKAPTTEAVEQTAPKPDPERAKRAEKAKSVNVSGSKTGKTRPLTSEEEMSRKYDEIQARS